MPAREAHRGRRLLRPRLLLGLDEVWEAGLATVVAPAGSGKTTLLEQWANHCDAPVVWLIAASSDATAAGLTQRLRTAIAGVMGDSSGPGNLQDVTSLLQTAPARLAIVVEDVHNIRGTEAESALGGIADALPPGVVMIVSSRRPPNLRLSRRRVSEALVELDLEDLRFRSWETEVLFRREFGISVVPEEAAALTTRTQGWAAGLQLFHLAVRDKSRSERLHLLGHFGGSFRGVGDYLADNVMAGLPQDITEFMIASSPLAVLTGDLCDAFLEQEGSAALLEDLERRELFLLRRGEGQAYSYHEILRSYLDGLLTARVGEQEARVLHYQAARLLLRSRSGSVHAPGDVDAAIDAAALRALCRAEAWREAVELISARGEQLAGPAAEIVSGIPDAVIDGDPWLQLASARRQLAAGSLREAVSAYERCESALPQSMALVARRERLATTNWLSPFPSPAPGWHFALRRAVAREPLSECASMGDDVVGLGCKALAHLLAGQVGAARELFESASLNVKEPTWDLAIRVGHTAAAMFGARDAEERAFVARRCLPLAAEADRLGSTWLTRQAHALLALVGETEIADEARRRCRADRDPWGEVIAGLLEGAGRLMAGETPIELLNETSSLARSLGAGVFEAFAMAELALALAKAQFPDAVATALSAEALARRAGVPAAQALCHIALSHCVPQSEEHSRHAELLAEECGLGLLSTGRIEVRSPMSPVDQVHTEPPSAGVHLRCFGGFEVWRSGQLVPEGDLRPRARSLLAILALHHPNPVHVDVLIESLWPDADYEAASHRMQTAISSLRRTLQPPTGTGADPIANALLRRGSAYVLADSTCDVSEFDECERVAATAQSDGDQAGEASALRKMLHLYGGDLLGEFGPAEWLIRERDRYRLMAADAAERLAEIELAAGRTAAAMAVANRGLSLDCYRESLWELAERTAEKAGDRAAAASLRMRRDAALSELDICID